MSALTLPPNVWLNPAETAARIGVHPVTLAQWRRKNRGPKFEKLGTSRTARIRYHVEDVDAWMRSAKAAA